MKQHHLAKAAENPTKLCIEYILCTVLWGSQPRKSELRLIMLTSLLLNVLLARSQSEKHVQYKSSIF